MSDWITNGPGGPCIERDDNPLGNEPKIEPYFQRLFEHMEREHGLTMPESEMQEIERIVLAMNQPKP